MQGTVRNLDLPKRCPLEVRQVVLATAWWRVWGGDGIRAEISSLDKHTPRLSNSHVSPPSFPPNSLPSYASSHRSLHLPVQL